MSVINSLPQRGGNLKPGKTYLWKGVGVAISNSEILIGFALYENQTPTVTVNSAAITTIGTVTATVDTGRTTRDALVFQLSTSVTQNYAYFCQVSFTVS